MRNHPRKVAPITVSGQPLESVPYDPSKHLRYPDIGLTPFGDWLHLRLPKVERRPYDGTWFWYWRLYGFAPNYRFCIFGWTRKQHGYSKGYMNWISTGSTLSIHVLGFNFRL